MQRQNSSERARLLSQYSTIGTLPHLTATKGPSPSRDAVFENLVARLERSIDIQNDRLRVIESCLKDLVTDKFDKLIEVNISIRDNTSRIAQRKRLMTTSPRKSGNDDAEEHIRAPRVRLVDTFKNAELQ